MCFIFFLSALFFFSIFFLSVEQQYFEVEKRLSHSQERLVNETRECQSLRLELEKLSKYLITSFFNIIYFY